MLINKEFLQKSSRSIIRYSLAQLIYLNTDDTRFYKLERLNNTFAGIIARKVLAANNIIILKSNFILDKFAKLNAEKRTAIEVRGIDGFIDDYLINDIDLNIEEFKITYSE